MDGTRTSQPVVQADLPLVDGTRALTFRDLIEVRFVDAFRQHGVGWRVIREANELGQQLFGNTHPFSTRKFRTDGRGIFVDIASRTEQDDPALLDIVRRQYAIKQIVAPYLKGLEISGADEILRWWPRNRRGGIVLDPERSFGEPILSTSGVPTRVLALAFAAEQSIERVAEWYQLRPRAVQAAVDYERQLAA
jgi:uncharacterized protein (DUF433 family)